MLYAVQVRRLRCIKTRDFVVLASPDSVGATTVSACAQQTTCRLHTSLVEILNHKRVHSFQDAFVRSGLEGV